LGVLNIENAVSSEEPVSIFHARFEG